MKRKSDDVVRERVAKTDAEGIEVTMPKRSMLFAGFVVRLWKKRTSRRVMMFGELVEGKGYPRG